MEREVKNKKKKKEEQQLMFDAGKVFTPETTKAEDFNLDMDRDSDTYRARKGESGDRRGEAWY